MPALPTATLPRVEYLEFENVGAHREFRFRITAPDQSMEARVRIAMTGFGPGGVRMQDGPDVSYQQLLRAIAAGESTDVITIGDADLVSYVQAHTPVAKHRSSAAASASSPAAPRTLPDRPKPTFSPRAPSPRLPAAPVATVVKPTFEQGTRVSHAVFGVGVTSASSDGHTVVHFDQDGAKTFVTALLALEVLSPPHTWETGPRGQNRVCGTTTRASRT